MNIFFAVKMSYLHSPEWNKGLGLLLPEILPLYPKSRGSNVDSSIDLSCCGTGLFKPLKNLYFSEDFGKAKLNIPSL